MKTLKILACAGLMMVLSACAGLVAPWSKQDYAGINAFELEFVDDAPLVKRTDGKGRENIMVEYIKSQDGTLTVKYSATGITVTGQEIRAAVDQAAVEAQIDILPSALDVITKAVCGAVGIPTC